MRPEEAARTSEADGLPTPRRYWSALAIWLAISMTVLDSSIANIALPTIAQRLNAPAADSVWVVNAYQLTITMLLLPLAALGDRIGYRRVYVGGLILFIIGSLACALAEGLMTLIAARMFQGIGAAAVMSMNSALVRATYPSSMLGKGMGYNAMVLATSAAIGPTLAALILSVASWRWLFAINVPVGLLSVAIGLWALPRAPGSGARADHVAALLSAATLGLLVFGTENLGRGLTETGLPMLVGGVIAGIALVLRERGRPAPLMPLDLLAIPIFRLSILTSIISFSAQMLAFVALPFLLQGALGRSVLESGLLMTPWPIAIAFAAPIAGRLADRYPAGLLGGIGLAIFAAGLFSLAMMGQEPHALDIAWRMALCGIGFGFFQSPNNRAMVSSAPRSRSGATGGMLATARVLGQTIGAVSVAAGFHWLGVGSAPMLIRIAAVAAALAALVSLLRLRIPQVMSAPAVIVDEA